MDKYLSIGIVRKTHGVKGELKIQIEPPYLDDFFEASVLFLDIKGKQVPYFIEETRAGNDLIVKLEEVNTREAAQDLCNKTIFLREQDLAANPHQSQQSQYTDLIGFQMEDSELGTIGLIEDVVEYPQQWLAVLQYQEKEVLVPLNPHFVKQIDVPAKCVRVTLPAGLLTL